MTTCCATRPAASEFVPLNLDATRWANLEPLYSALRDRPIADAAALETFLIDRSELDAAAGEAEANLYIAMTCNTEDEGARSAFLTFVEQVEPRLREASFALDTKVAESPFGTKLDHARYEVLLRSIRQEVRLFRPQNIPLQTECTKLDQQYSQIAGAMLVEFQGTKQTMPQMMRHLENTDRIVRESSWKAVATRRLADRERIDGLFDQLVQLRNQIGRNAGFDNFRDYQHQKLQRFDYATADCFKYHEACALHVVPLSREVDAQRAQALTLDTLRPWDLKVDLHGRAGLAPFNGADELVERSSRLFHSMDADLGRLFDSMRTGGCLDLESRKGKAPGGYQYQRARSRRPFIFMNASGLQRDVVTMIHEAGHAFHSMLCAHDPILPYRGSPMEFAEVASMGMELLADAYIEEFYSPADAARARRDHIEGILTTLPWVAQIDSFQHWIYTHPDHTRTERTATWVELSARFGSAVSWSGLEEAHAAAWQRQLHLFGSPFYYIEYGIAQLGALQLWVKARKDPQAALAGYRRALSLGGSRPLPELFSAAGLRFDFGPDTVRTLIDEVRGELARHPA